MNLCIYPRPIFFLIFFFTFFQHMHNEKLGIRSTPITLQTSVLRPYQVALFFPFFHITRNKN